MAGNTLNNHVGPVYQADGNASVDLRQGSHSEAIVQQSGGKYKEVAKRQKLFHAVNATARAPQTAFSGTALPLAIYNPLGSGVRAIIKRVHVTLGATGTIGNGHFSHACCTINGPVKSQAGVVPTGTAVTPQNADIGGPLNSSMTVLENVTVASGGVQEMSIHSSAGLEVAGTTVSPLHQVNEDADADIVVEPGGLYTLGSVLANSSSPLVFISMVWEEESIYA